MTAIGDEKRPSRAEDREPRGSALGDARAVLLDGLGTLVALEPPWPALVARLREAHGVELSLVDAKRAFAAEIVYYRAHHHEGRDAATLEDLRRRCAEVLRARLPADVGRALSLGQLQAAMLSALRFTAYPDAPPSLAALRARGVARVVVSNWDASLPEVLRGVGLEGLVDGVVTSARVGCPKPGREIFRAALALTGSSPMETVHVGDSIEHDVQGALAAGIRPVLLRREQTERERPPAGVPSISSLSELLA
jgi:HAD superfamily hydrolase (TIGR01509 family)